MYIIIIILLYVLVDSRRILLHRHRYARDIIRAPNDVLYIKGKEGREEL